MGTSESTDEGDSETTDGPVDECPADPELLALSFAIDGLAWFELEGGIFAQSCSVTANNGTLADGETIELACPTNGADETFAIEIQAQSSDGQGPIKVAAEPGQQVEWLRWINPGWAPTIAVVMRDTASQRLLLASLGDSTLPMPGFIDNVLPEPGFLAPCTVELIATGCPAVCDPGGGLFLPACDTCTTERAVTLTIGDESVSIEHNSVASAPDGDSTIWGFVRSLDVTSENCSDYNGSTEVILVAG